MGRFGYPLVLTLGSVRDSLDNRSEALSLLQISFQLQFSKQGPFEGLEAILKLMLINKLIY